MAEDPNHRLDSSTSLFQPEESRNDLITEGPSGRLDIRRKRALHIYNGERPIVHVSGCIWKVPSQSSSQYYVVSLEIGDEYCECPDNRKTRHACKHILAAKLKAAKAARGKLALPTRPDRHPNVPGYDAMKSREQRSVEEQLRCLALLIPYHRHLGAGRPPTPMGDILICNALAGYHNRSTRRAIPDPEVLVARGITRGIPPCETTLRLAAASLEYNAVVKNALAIAARCVAGFGSTISIDGVYVKTPNLEIATKDAFGKTLTYVSQSTSNLIYAIECRSLVAIAGVVQGEGSEQPAFLPLLEEVVRQGFPLGAVTADAGFNKAAHYEAVHALGARAYLDFDKGAKPRPGFRHYNEMLCLWLHHRWTLFNSVYMYRKLIECANSILQRTVKRTLRAGKTLSVENEALTLLLVHSLMRLHAVRHEYKIALPFCDERALAVIDGVDHPDIPILVPTRLAG